LDSNCRPSRRKDTAGMGQLLLTPDPWLLGQRLGQGILRATATRGPWFSTASEEDSEGLNEFGVKQKLKAKIRQQLPPL